jgi:hypothetical protein
LCGRTLNFVLATHAESCSHSPPAQSSKSIHSLRKLSLRAFQRPTVPFSSCDSK